MADFYLDNNVARPLTQLLLQAGHRAIHTRDQRHQRAPDDEQLLLAAERRQTLITHDEDDFTLLHNAWQRWTLAWDISPAPRHAGILILQPDTPRTLLSVLENFLAPTPDILNALYRWRRNSGWWHWDQTDYRWVRENVSRY